MWYPSILSLLTLSIHLLALVPGVVAQDVPLRIQGGLEDAIATDSSFNMGGTIVVNGFTMNTPTSLLVQLPAAWVPWKTSVASKSEFLGYETLVRP